MEIDIKIGVLSEFFKTCLLEIIVHFPSKRFKIRRVRLQSSDLKSIVRRPRSFGRAGSKFVPKTTNRRYQFRSRTKESDETNERNESAAINNDPIVKASRRRFTPSSGARNKYRLNINTRPLPAEEDVTSNVNPASDSEPLNIRPTPSLSSGKYQETQQEPLSEPAEALHLDNYPIIISSIDNDISGMTRECWSLSTDHSFVLRPDHRHPRALHPDQGPVRGDSYFIVRGVQFFIFRCDSISTVYPQMSVTNHF